MHYDTTWYPLFLSSSSSFHHIHFFTQTLTTLNLDANQIDPLGALYLAECVATQHGNALSLTFLLISPYSLFHTDTQHTQPQQQWNRSCGSATFGRCITTRTWWPPFLLPSLFHHIYFFTQTLTTLNLDGNEIAATGAQHLADALRQNTGDPFPLTSLPVSPYPLFFTQILITLHLYCNQIGPVGAQHLADALRHNTVILFLSPSFSFHHIHFSTQTLTTVNLSSNEICPVGAQHLADALRHNTVTIFLSLFSPLFTISALSHRHSPHSISGTMKSVLWEHNIWAMHYDRTRWPSFSRLSPHFTISTSSHRYSPHSISPAIKSVLWEHNI